MGLTRNEAYSILELPLGAPLHQILRSYKALALQWYPEKHKNCPAALTKFHKISQAYKVLTSDEKDTSESLTMREMLGLFQDVFFGDENLYDGDDSSDLSDGTMSLESETDLLADHLSACDFHMPKRVTAEEAKSNAEALIAEEEREKKKAEKKKAKKKRRKLKKKLGKEASDKNDDKKENGAHTPQCDTRNTNSESSDTNAEEDLDLNSAFVAVIANKRKKDFVGVAKKTIRVQQSSKESDMETNPTVLRSRKVAIRGNEMASVGHYQEAADLFSEAIRLNPTDYRFYGNRSYCYDRLGQFERALRDAEKAIILSSKWPKGYFRKGRALVGLKNYSEAQKAFEEVLRLDKDCEDAVQELIRIKALQIASRNLPKQVEANHPYTSVQDTLPTGASATGNCNVEDEEIYLSDDGSLQSNIFTPQNTDEKMDPRNPEGHTSLWVGNVTQDITEKMLISTFSKYGEMLSIRLLPEKYCAFINYCDKWSVSKAMVALQGKEVCGQNLVIRYPDHPMNKSVTVLRKNKASAGAKSDAKTKSVGPVNGDECYFWRTTGCVFGECCRFKHIKEHQGIDRKHWHDEKIS